MMKFGVMVLEGPYQHEAADSAYHFVQAALACGTRLAVSSCTQTV